MSPGGRKVEAAAGSEAPGEGDDSAADRRYLAQVMAEIDEEVRRRRASGDLPARVERELDELFLEHSPVGGPRRRAGRGVAHGRRRRLHRPRRPGRLQQVGRGGRQEGPAVAQPLVHRLRHPPGEPVRHRREPVAAPPGRSGGRPAPPAGGPAGPAGPGGGGALGGRGRRLVGARGGRGAARRAGPGAARRLGRRLAGAGAQRQGRRRLRGRPPAGPGRPGRRWTAPTCARRRCSSTSGRSSRPAWAGSC